MSEPMTKERIVELKELCLTMPPSAVRSGLWECLKTIERLQGRVNVAERPRTRNAEAMKCSACGGYSLALSEGSNTCNCEYEAESEVCDER